MWRKVSYLHDLDTKKINKGFYTYEEVRPCVDLLSIVYAVEHHCLASELPNRKILVTY